MVAYSFISWSRIFAHLKGPLMEKSAEMLANALTTELVKLKEQIGSMADQFSEKFDGQRERI